MTVKVSRSRKSRRNLSTWPLAIAIVLCFAIHAYPLIGLLILAIAGTGIFLAMVVVIVYAIRLYRGKAKPPARIARDKKNHRWMIDFM